MPPSFLNHHRHQTVIPHFIQACEAQSSTYRHKALSFHHSWQQLPQHLMCNDKVPRCLARSCSLHPLPNRELQVQAYNMLCHQFIQ